MKEKEKRRKGETRYKYTETVPSSSELGSAVTYLQRHHSPGTSPFDSRTSFGSKIASNCTKIQKLRSRLTSQCHSASISMIQWE
jgi:hypothetical protein